MIRTFSKKADGNYNISKNFKVKEFACKDGSDVVKIDCSFVQDKLQKLRDYFKLPMTITSGYRTESYNKKVGGAKNSYHMKGMAFDVQISGVKPQQIAKAAEELGILGIIEYYNFVHVDSREKKFFSMDTGKTSCQSFFTLIPIESTPELKEKVIQGMMAGKYGNGQERKRRVEALGFDYKELQKEVNQRLKGGK